MQQLRALLKAVMLRRMKNSQIDGKPILILPPKIEVTDEVVFSEDETNYYRQLETQSRVLLNKYLRQGTVGKNYSNILVLLLRLRQACCHPHLNMDFDYATILEEVSDDAKKLAKLLEPQVVARIKAIESFECPICYDAVQDPTLLIPCGHDSCSECFASLSDSSIQENARYGRDSTLGKCPQCRGPIDTARVIRYTTFKQVHMTQPIEREDDDDVEMEETEKVTPDDHAHTDVQDGGAADGEDIELPDLTAGLRRQAQAAGETPAPAQAQAQAENTRDKGKAKAEDVEPHQLRSLRADAPKNMDARRRYMNYLRMNWQPSAKVTKVIEILRDIKPTDEKTIIFSQWTSLLDLLEIAIEDEVHLGFCRYDGGMSRNKRDESVKVFIDNPDCRVMLISLRAGNAGLNLTAASRIIICDPFWNPYTEMQAVDRAHRIGQQREIRVHRVLVRGTVEDRIVDLQERKRALVDAALDEREDKQIARLTIQELRYLFGALPPEQ